MSDKQFARAKAIAVLECMAIDITGALAEMSKENTMAEVLQQRLEAIDTAQAALREQADHFRDSTKKAGWIGVNDRLPKPHETVLVIRLNQRKKLSVECGYYMGNGDWQVGTRLTRPVTHWMPLPDVPEVEV